MTAYFSVRNFDQFQHYKTGAHSTGKPSWIKVYTSILTDYDISGLPDAAVGHLVRIWVLASQMNNKLPWDAKWIAQRIGASSTVNLELLEGKGFIERLDRSENPSRPDSKDSLDRSDESQSPLISSVLLSSSQKEKEEEDDPNAPVTVDELVDGWNTMCAATGLPTVREVGETRKKHMRARLKEHPMPDFWKTVLDNIRGSPFLQGQGGKWRADFDWLIENDNNAIKVYEGKYAPEAIRRERRPNNGGFNSIADMSNVQQKFS